MASISGINPVTNHVKDAEFINVVLNGIKSDVSSGNVYGWMYKGKVYNVQDIKKSIGTFDITQLVIIPVFCDRCNKANLSECYHYSNTDLCCECALHLLEKLKSDKPLSDIQSLDDKLNKQIYFNKNSASTKMRGFPATYTKKVCK